jgi:hypothetical protein
MADTMGTDTVSASSTHATCACRHLSEAFLHLALGIWVSIKGTVTLLAVGIFVLHLWLPATSAAAQARAGDPGHC